MKVYIGLENEKIKDKLVFTATTAETLPLPGRSYNFRFDEKNTVEYFEA